jgi:hypothetical protein
MGAAGIRNNPQRGVSHHPAVHGPGGCSCYPHLRFRQRLTFRADLRLTET